ncbi:MAG: V-type ATP synthase subunit F [Candidatus Micrarchaeota archaeon]
MVKAKIIVLGDAPLVLGLQLAGIEHGIIATDEDFQSKLEDILNNQEFGIIITTERMLLAIDWRLKKKLDDSAYPVIVPMPDASGSSSASQDEVRNLIKRALGFDLGNKN